MKIEFMSYLEAHKILNDYVDDLAHASNALRGMGFRRASEFSNTKEEIICAYKVFMAVLYRYGGNDFSKEEVDRYDMMVMSLGIVPWVEDKIADEYIECERILRDNSFLGKIKNRKKIPFIKKRKDEIRKEILACKNINDNLMHEIGEFQEAIVDLSKRSQQWAREVQDDMTELEKVVTQYCLDAYEIIGLTVREEDVRVFLPIPLLQKLAKSEHYTEEERRYIFRNVK